MNPPHASTPGAVFAAFLKLGLTSFGGPVAHLGYFREDLVERRGWVDERGFADLVALSQFLPGPASSQVGIAVGVARAGLPGGLAAWLGFVLPSALALFAFAALIARFPGGLDAGWFDGLKVVAVAVVARAVWRMAVALCPDAPRATLAIAAAVAVLAWPGAPGQILAIACGGLIGWLVLRADLSGTPAAALGVTVSRPLAVGCLAGFVALLIGLPLVAGAVGGLPLALADGFYRSGALVFGGGHVILPLLQAEVVAPGWIDKNSFLAGYGAAQAVPGPLLSFTVYLGAMIDPRWGGAPAALLCLLAAYLPSFLLVIGVLPFWESLRRRGAVQSAMRGVNAAVVGILLAALYDPVWTNAIHGPSDFALAVAAFAALALWKLPPWLVVILCGVVGAVL